MITPDQVMIMVQPVDMRLGVDGLSSLVQQALQRSACDGRLYLFRNRAGNRLKALRWDGNGVWLCQRRLHQGKFHWVKQGDACMVLTSAQFEALVMGLEWQRIHRTAPSHWQV
jgi:transposase